MVGRPPLPVGTHGKIRFVAQASGTVQARTTIRDYDGRRRLVTKVGRSKAAAERSLREAIRDRQQPGATAGLTPASTVGDLADLWVGEDSGRSPATDRVYRNMIRAHIRPALGELRLSEINAGVIARALSSIAEHSGTGAAKSTRSALSGMFRIAVRDGAIGANPVRDAGVRLSPRAGSAAKRPRALALEEEQRLVELFAASSRARELDVVDLVDWMLATGCRLGEALAARMEVNSDGKQLIDLDAGTWEINGTIVRIPKQGLIVQPRTKTAAGWRVVALPGYACELVRRRGTQSGLVFPSLMRTPRDPSNVSHELRRLLDGFDCADCAGTGLMVDRAGSPLLSDRGKEQRCDRGPWSWVTSHTFRKTVATKLDIAGFSPREAADHLGHASPSMTLDVYFGRHVVSAAAATALDRA